MLMFSICPSLADGPYSVALNFPKNLNKGSHLLSSSLLSSLVLLVDPTEVGHDDRNWEGNDQNTTQRTDGTKDLPRDGLWNHVTISDNHRRH